MIGNEDTKTIFFILLAAFAGALGYISDMVEREQSIKWSLALLKGLSSGLMGFLIMLVCAHYNISSDLAGSFAGICGWIGADAIVPMIEKIAKRRFGIYDDNLFYRKYNGAERRSLNQKKEVEK